MNYIKTEWENGDVVTSSKLNNIENGISELAEDVNHLSEEIDEIIDEQNITITLNGNSTSSPSFYAPTSVGTSGQYLKSNGSGAPSWANFPTIPTINFNGSNTSSPVFFAPTNAGTSGYFLKSNGFSNTPTWAEIKIPNIANIKICQHSESTFDYMLGYIVDNHFWTRSSVVTGGYYLYYYSEPIPKEQNISLAFALTSSMVQHFDVTVSGDISQTPITRSKKTGESTYNSTMYYCYIITGDCSIDLSLK